MTFEDFLTTAGYQLPLSKPFHAEVLRVFKAGRQSGMEQAAEIAEAMQRTTWENIGDPRSQVFVSRIAKAIHKAMEDV